MAHYHQQMWCSSHLEVVIISFFFREVGNVPYGCSYPASSLASSSTVAPSLLISLLPAMGPGRTAAIWRFQKATPLAKVVTMSPRMTLVDSKFNLLTKAVTTSIYCLSSSVWSGGTMGLVNLTTDAVVGMVERTVVSPSGRGFARSGGVCPTLSAVGEAIDSTGGVSFSGGDPNIDGVAPCTMCLPEFDPMALTSVMVAWVMGALGEPLDPGFTVSVAILPRPWRMSHL